MPNRATFSIPPISVLLDRYLAKGMVIVDPFSGDSMRGTLRNDLRDGGMKACVWLATLPQESADVLLFDPPYSPRQISECYKSVGMVVHMQDAQSSFYKNAKDAGHRVVKPGGIVVCCGWNSLGFGLTRGYEMIEILLVTHGGAHNDTIVTVERRR